MIKFVPHNEINKHAWEECINNSINALIYANSWYLDIVCPNWNAVIVDDYKAVFPLPSRTKLGIKYIYPPFFVQQLGLFFTEEKYNTENFIKLCLNEIPEEYKLVEIYLNEKNLITPDINCKIKNRKTYLLDLKENHEIIQKNYTKGLKGKIKKTQQDNIELINTDQPDKLINLFRENTGNNLNKFKEEDYLILHNLTNECIKRNSAEITLAYLDNELLAGGIFLYYKNRITYLFSAASPQGKKYAAISLLLHHVIKEHSQKNYIFDFEGSMVESIAKFFRSFGSSESVYLHLKMNRLPRLLRWLKD
ncbi:MAG: GNAT family N-acetyltransferase [Bacteroidia bacterium]